MIIKIINTHQLRIMYYNVDLISTSNYLSDFFALCSYNACFINININCTEYSKGKRLNFNDKK